MTCLDYGRSFVCTNGPANAPQFWLESRCRLIDERAGTTEDYYQGASCKSEHTFAEKDLFQNPNYDFLPVFGKEDVAIFRRHSFCNENYVQYVKAGNIWGGPRFILKEAKGAREARDGAEIVRAALAGIPFVSRTEVWNAATGMRAVLECPVKTMNVNEAGGIYQVDTGPVLFPDLTQRYERKIEALRLAFVAFNAPDFADFVIEQPTPIVRDGKTVCEVYHYSGILSLPAKNTVFVIGE